MSNGTRIEIALYGIKIDTVNDMQVDLWKQFISKERRKRAEQFRYRDDLKRCVIGEMIARYAIHKMFQIDADGIEFEILQYGKPVVKGQGEWYFNLSHSGQWVVCAVGMCPVGIDVEKMDMSHLCIARSCFTLNENKRIQAFSSDRDKMLEFYKLWTLKESYIKTIGLGLLKGMNTFELRLEDGKEVLVDKEGYDREYSFYSEVLGERYVMSLCFDSIAKLRKLELLDGKMLGELYGTFWKDSFGGAV